MSYKVSLIVPVYNAENSIEKLIKSIINQSIGFENIELIIVNDKSTDNTENIVKKYSDKYENVKLFTLSENSGAPGRPRNVGIENATADYIIFSDADDVYLENAFERYYEVIKSEGSDFVMGSHYWDLGTNDLIKINILHDEEDINNPNNDIVNINPWESQRSFNKLAYNHVSPWGKIFKKETILKNNVRFLDKYACEETFFYFSTLKYSSKVTLLPNDQLYIYVTDDNSSSFIHSHDIKKFNSFLNGFSHVYDVIKTFPFDINIPLTDNIGYLLLFFSNVEKKSKKEAALKLYEFEKSIDREITLPRKELDVLNKLILKKHFSLAIKLSDFYSFLYANNTIKKLYRTRR